MQNDTDRFAKRTMELAEDLCKFYAQNMMEYAYTATQNWKGGGRRQMTAFATAMGIGMIGGTLVSAVRNLEGEEAAAAVHAVLLGAIENSAKP